VALRVYNWFANICFLFSSFSFLWEFNFFLGVVRTPNKSLRHDPSTNNKDSMMNKGLEELSQILAIAGISSYGMRNMEDFEVIEILDEIQPYQALMGLEWDFDSQDTINFKRMEIIFEVGDLKVTSPLDP
jgi:hypothetical protein